MPREDIILTKLARQFATEPEEMATDVEGNYGLSQGHVEWHLTPNSPDFERQTVRRSICDVGVFISISGQDVDVALTHFHPNAMRRKALIYVINALRQKRHRPGTRFVTLVTSHPFHDKGDENKEDRSFWYKAVAAARRYNNKRSPDIIEVDPKAVEATSSELVISRDRVDDDFLFTIQLTNSRYRKTFLQSDAEKASKQRPLRMRISA